MNPPREEIYPPIGMIADVSSAPRDELSNSLTPADWEQVAALVQQVLGPMAERIVQQRPDVRALPGQTQGQGRPFLFAYWTFDIPTDHAITPTVVGVDFDRGANEDEVRIRGDISAEETGLLLFETDVHRVANSRLAVMAGADKVATILAKEEQAVLGNLLQPAVDY